MDNELDQLGERIAEQAAHLDAAMHRLLVDLREFDARGGWHAQGAVTCAHWLAWRVGWDLVTARDHVRVARKIAEFPVFDDALRRGEVSYSKVRAMLRVATPENEVLLLEHAKLMTASQLEKLCRRYALVQRHGEDAHSQADEQRRYVRRRDTEDGMVKIEAVLHPEEAELVWAMLDHAAAQLVHEPGSRSGRDSAESRDAGPARSEVALAPTAPLTTAPGNGPDAAARLNSDQAVTPMIALSIDDSAESRDAGPVARSEVALAHTVPLATTPDTGPDAAACLISDGTVAKAIASSIDDSAESRDADPATRSEVALAHNLPLATAPDSGSDPAACLISDGTVAQAIASSIDDSAESWAACNRPPPSDTQQRSVLDQLLHAAEALRRVEVTGRNVGSADVREAECEIGVFEEETRHQSDVLVVRREAGSLRDRAAVARRAFSRADALVEVAQGYLRGNRPERSPVEVVLTIPASCLHASAALDPVEAGELGESFLSSETVRRLSCDAGVVEVVQDDQGVPLSVGRKRRTIAGALQRALRKRDGACSFPGCTNRIFLEGHHIQHWADGGETSLRNTALLCTLHHRYVHEYGYTIELGPDQRPRFRDPHGRWVKAAPERPNVTGLGWPQIRAANAALQIDASTIAGPWDGTPVDYGRIAGHLAVADGLT
ncbi:MAG TPA: DUF222 domain-containing protein [Kofleriaceae bacterium]|nr:DUF222 domain-containing protein [Kofleriaceae bacterium]